MTLLAPVSPPNKAAVVALRPSASASEDAATASL
jgi:hypothetical protein